MAAELANSPPAISDGTSPEAAKALKEWHRRYMSAGKEGAIKPMFSKKEDLIAWLKEDNKPEGVEKGKPEKLDDKGNVKREEVPTKITWRKPLPDGNVFTFVEYKWQRDFDAEKER